MFNILISSSAASDILARRDAKKKYRSLAMGFFCVRLPVPFGESRFGKLKWSPCVCCECGRFARGSCVCARARICTCVTQQINIFLITVRCPMSVSLCIIRTNWHRLHTSPLSPRPSPLPSHCSSSNGMHTHPHNRLNNIYEESIIISMRFFPRRPFCWDRNELDCVVLNVHRMHTVTIAEPIGIAFFFLFISFCKNAAKSIQRHVLHSLFLFFLI